MTQEDKELLLKYLCMALPYRVIVEIISYGQEKLKPWFGELSCKDLDCLIHCVAYQSIKPYLRPMSSMTNEERAKYHSYCDKYYDIYFDTVASIDWLNAHHFDYRGLIEKGLAIEVTENNNPYKE